MTPHDFIAHFDTIAEAPNGIARLRELVLQLAVRGKLVPQNPADEPATRLIERATVKRTQSAKKTGSKKSAPPSSDMMASGFASDSEGLPSGWAWTCTAALGVLNPKNKIEDDTKVSFCPMPVIPTDYRESVVGETRRWGDIRKGYTHFAEGDVVVAKITPCFQNRKSCIMTGLEGSVGAGTTELHVVRPFTEAVAPKYLLLFYKSPDFLKNGVARMTGTAGQQRIPREYFAYTPLPLPPLAEQNHIVAKVGKLMDLLDRLEEARYRRESIRTTSRDSALAALRAAGTANEIKSAWIRIATRMDDLFINPHDVTPLRKLVLQLAVQGRIVSQNPQDEPATMLLERIKAERDRLVRDKKISKSKMLPEITSNETLVEVPKGWTVARFGDIFLEVFTGPFGTSLKKSEYIGDGTPVINPQNLKSGCIVPSPEMAVGPATLKRLAGFRILRDDLVVARRGEMGRCAVVGAVETGWLCGTGSMVLRPAKGIYPPFVAMFLRSPSTVDRLSGDSVGETMKNLNQRIMLNLVFAIPPAAEQHRIVTKVDELMDLLDHLEETGECRDAVQSVYVNSALHYVTL